MKNGIRTFLIISCMTLGTGVWAASEESFDPVSSLYEKANEYFRRGSYSSAINVFQLIVDNHPENPLAPEAIFSIASSKHKMNDVSGARASYQELLNKYPAASAVPDAMLQLGTLMSETGDPAGARDIWTRLMKEHKGSIAAKVAGRRIQSVAASGVRTQLAPERPLMPAPSADMTPLPSDEPVPEFTAPPAPVESKHSKKSKSGEKSASSFGESGTSPAVYIVRKGDSISKIAQKFLGSRDRYRELAKLNKIAPPYTLEVGQKIRLSGVAASSAGKSASKTEHPASVMESEPPASEFEPMPWVVPPMSMDMDEPAKELPAAPPVPHHEKPSSKLVPPTGARAPSPPVDMPGASDVSEWEPMVKSDMKKDEDLNTRLQQWVDNRSEGYESLQTRLLELQQDVRGQKVMAKQLELLREQLTQEQQQNQRLKQELVGQAGKLKDMKEKNTSLVGHMENLTNSLERTKAAQAAAAELEEQMIVHRQKMETLEKQNQVLSETLQKMRGAFDAQIGLVKTYYDSQLARTRHDYEMRMDTTTAELSWLRDDNRQKEQSLTELKKDYADLMKKTAAIQKEAIVEKQTRVSLTAAKQAMDKARDLRRLGKTAEAEAAYREALNVYPDYADAMNGLAYMYVEDRRNLDDAERLVEKAISVDPQGRGYYLDTLGWLQYMRQAYTAALDVLMEAHRRIPVEDLPARAAVSYHIGKVYQAVSDKDKAFFHFIDAIKLAPRTRWATLAEKELDTL